MLDQSFWLWLESKRKSGHLTRERTEKASVDISEAYSLLMEYVKEDMIDRGQMISQSLKCWLAFHTKEKK